MGVSWSIEVKVPLVNQISDLIGTDLGRQEVEVNANPAMIKITQIFAENNMIKLEAAYTQYRNGA